MLDLSICEIYVNSGGFNSHPIDRPAILGGGQLREICKLGNENSNEGYFCSMITYIKLVQ